MKILFHPFKFILPFITVIQISPMVLINEAAADDFGRFFTTPMQRQYLDQLKSRGAPIVVNIDEELSPKEITSEATEETDAVTVKGLVYRKGGKSAAWLNESNTFEGDIASGYTDVDEGGISPSGIQLTIGNRNNINLKVGQKFEPVTEEIRDIVKETDSRISVSRP